MFFVKRTFNMFYFCRKIVFQNRHKENIFRCFACFEQTFNWPGRAGWQFFMRSDSVWSILSMYPTDQRLVVHRRSSGAPLTTSRLHAQVYLLNRRSFSIHDLADLHLAFLREIIGFITVQNHSWKIIKTRLRCELFILISRSFNFMISLEDRLILKFIMHKILMEFFPKNMLHSLRIFHKAELRWTVQLSG
jgi:hypothetical protein